MGTIERGIYTRGRQYWIRYRYQGRPKREPAGTSLEQARLLLARKRIEIGERRYREGADRVTVQTVLDDYQAHLEVLGRKASSRQTIQSAARTLLATLGGAALAIDIRPASVDRYVQQRLAQGRARGTVHTEVAVLRAALRWAAECDRIPTPSRLRGVGGVTVRQGFLEPDAFERIVALLHPDDADMARFLFLTGRRYEEAAGLTWGQVRRDEIAWDALKNGEGLTLPLFRTLAVLLKARRAKRTVGLRLVATVFHYEGRSLSSTFRRHFKRAAMAAGAPGLVPHDLRRSALRNLIRAGVSEAVAMTISGHRSRDVFSRYDITSRRDQADAFDKLEAYLDRAQAGHRPVAQLRGKATRKRS